MSTPGIPDLPSPPKAMVAAAKAERARRKACHGNWYPCETVEHVPDAWQLDCPHTGNLTTNSEGQTRCHDCGRLFRN